MESSAKIRSNMSKGQLLTCDIRDARVLEAVNAVKREDFVPASFALSAYVDEEIPLAPGRYLMEPLAFCRLLELAEISASDKVLDIACGLGYSSAVFSKLARKVIALEENPELVNEARKRLDKYNPENTEVITSPLMGGVPAQRPFDVIFIGGAVQSLSAKLLEQLAEGGRLITVENINLRPGERTGLGRTLRIIRHGNHYRRQEGKEVSVPLLPGFEKRPIFEF